MKYDIAKIEKEDAIIKALFTDLYWNFKEIILSSKYIKELFNNWIKNNYAILDKLYEKWFNNTWILWDKDAIFKCPENIKSSEKDEYWIICDIVNNEWISHELCCRSKLRILQNELKRKWNNWELYIWTEIDAYFIKDINYILNDKEGNNNCLNPRSNSIEIITEIINTLWEFWFEIESSYTEKWENQFKINWKVDKAEKTSDKIQLYRLISYKIWKLYDYNVNFLSKPFPNKNANSMNFNFFVSNERENLFYSSKNQKNFFSLWDNALSFIQWIINNTRSISAISNKTESSYWKFIFWNNNSWQIIWLWIENKKISYNISNVDDIKNIKKNLKIEANYPDPIANPYLLSSVFIIAWIEWIEKKLEFEGFSDNSVTELSYKELKENWYEILAKNLWESYKDFYKNDLFKEKLWENIFNLYSDLILDEIEKCQIYSNVHSINTHLYD